jgi:hypothetical protein
MPITNLKASDLKWRKAKRKRGGGACVEVASADGQVVVVRDSKDRPGNWLYYSEQSWREYTARPRRILFLVILNNRRSTPCQLPRRNVEAAGLRFGP